MNTYKSPAYPLLPVLGVIIACGEVVVLWMDPESGRKSLLMTAATYLLAFCYHRSVLMRRQGGWVMTGPDDIDAVTAQKGGRLQSAPGNPVVVRGSF